MARSLPSTYLYRITVADFANPTALAREHHAMREATAGHVNLCTVLRAEDVGREPAFEVWGDPT